MQDPYELPQVFLTGFAYTSAERIHFAKVRLQAMLQNDQPSKQMRDPAYWQRLIDASVPTEHPRVPAQFTEWRDGLMAGFAGGEHLP
jgi:hypothetical protein